ncbi:hypothetical protein STEG23_019162 [Scotinomys teguina]
MAADPHSKTKCYSLKPEIQTHVLGLMTVTSRFSHPVKTGKIVPTTRLSSDTVYREPNMQKHPYPRFLGGLDLEKQYSTSYGKVGFKMKSLNKSENHCDQMLRFLKSHVHMDTSLGGPSSKTLERDPYLHHQGLSFPQSPSQTPFAENQNQGLENPQEMLSGPRSTRTPLHHKSPPGTQEHPDAIGLEGPRSTQTPLDQEDPGVTKRYWTKRTQEYPRRHWTRRSQKHP